MVKMRSIQRGVITLIGVVLVIVLTACSSTSGEDGTGKVQVTATTGMIADVAREVGGVYVEVTGLMGPGVDPHLYKASQGDIRKLEQAKVIFYNGLHLEGKMTSILEKMSKSKQVTAVVEKIPVEELHSGQATGGTEYDPHVWFNVKHWMRATEAVRDTLVEADPDHAEQYKTQAATYLEKLQALDTEVREKIGQIPEESRVLVTAHDAFGYFGQAYGIKVMGLQGISTAAEYGAKDVSELRDFLVENQIKAVFIESSVPAKAMEAIIAGAAEKGHTVKIGGELFSDAIGAEGTVEGTYIGMVRHNVETIAAALK
ncbi:metal ABC transporter solute-binding protein, Zn/Mn family [Paenibacillus cucumis (ex Kampfer et al. 2016)]|uniref:Zinc ABC transporter substrate-binding protein n=1 Tax=Paenibacillus cucumis (ex Kampfer et al. 2016) TaxID=1776858 RepID=A0ABS7KMP8_9BACL|nr:zinc ABC transporter substrate-binding protein [Paenibacillus cucumis (ex Kampfer et al. 2016)]MBY0205457.1 zinc ABC transporter substrate-binding protein [Paenibacillus cucumis (ex Kampfer et al. 2016)]